MVRDFSFVNTAPLIGTNYRIYHVDLNLTPEQIHTVSENRNSRYVGEFSLPGKDGKWMNFPSSVFYTGKGYFGIFFNEEGIADIVSADKAMERVYTGVIEPKTNQILYSSFKDDDQDLYGVSITGGLEDPKFEGEPILFVVKEGEFHAVAA